VDREPEVLRLLDPSDSLAQDLPDLFFHRPTVLSGADPKAMLQPGIQIANGDAGHAVILILRVSGVGSQVYAVIALKSMRAVE
jgi:hypothetical protein